MAIGPIFRSIMQSPAGALLIALQIALTLAIVSNAVFIIKERIDKMARPSGMLESEIITARVFYFSKNVDYKAQAKQDLQFFANLPGIKSAAYTNAIPLGGSGSSTTLCKTIGKSDKESCPYSVASFQGGEKLLNTFGLELISGRNFRPEEISANNPDGGTTVTSGLIIVSKAVADIYFPNGNAIGNTVYMDDKPHSVIGIVRKIQSPWTQNISVKNELGVLLSATAYGAYNHLVIRAEPELISSLRHTIANDLLSMNDRRVITSVRTVDDLRARQYRNDKAMSVILMVVIALLVVITALGTSGLVSFSVTNRKKQIGTRRALGARKMDILNYFMLENGLICVAGAIVGAMMAIGLNQYLMQTYDLSRIEFGFIATASIMVLLIGQLAAYFPARRACDISPAISTRTV